VQARAVLRDVGRVLACRMARSTGLSSSSQQSGAPVTLEQRSRRAGAAAAANSDDSVARLITIALKLEGLYRHASTHAAGVVIGDRPLTELVRSTATALRHSVTQFNMKRVGAAGW